MPASPWLTIASPAPDRDYLALISYLPLRHFRAVPKFFWFTLQTQRQLTASKGLIGYALDARPFARKFWTFSAWEDQQALNDFVRQIPHSKIMQVLAPHMGKTQFAQWKVKPSEIPLNWRDAKARLGQA